MCRVRRWRFICQSPLQARLLIWWEGSCSTTGSIMTTTDQNNLLYVPVSRDCKGLFQSRTWIFCYMFSRSEVMSRLMWKFSAKNDTWSHAFVHLWKKKPCKIHVYMFCFCSVNLIGISKSFAKLVDHIPGFRDVGILHGVELPFCYDHNEAELLSLYFFFAGSDCRN